MMKLLIKFFTASQQKMPLLPQKIQTNNMTFINICINSTVSNKFDTVQWLIIVIILHSLTVSYFYK